MKAEATLGRKGSGGRRATQVACWCRALLAVSFLLPVALHAAGPDLIIVRADGVVVRFAVEIADTDAKRTLGLMRRPSLAPRSGMLFDFARRARIRMWMKNTLIPLDMLFVDVDGTVIHIARETQPYSTALIEAPAPARYVLEINGGEAGWLGINIGDKLRLADPSTG